MKTNINVRYTDLRKGGVALLPVRIGIVGVGNSSVTYPATPKVMTSELQAARQYGFGSPIHRAVKVLLPQIGENVGTIPVTVYPASISSGGAAATGTITVSEVVPETEVITVNISGIKTQVKLEKDTTVADAADAIAAAISAASNMPVTAVSDSVDTIALTAKWEGESGNGIKIDVDSETTIAVVDMDTGAGTVDLTTLGNIAEWTPLIVNCMAVNGTVLSGYDSWGESVWQPEQQKPAMVFHGLAADLAGAKALSTPQRDSRTNAICNVQDTVTLPAAIAASAVLRVANQAFSNPPVMYTGQSMKVEEGTPLMATEKVEAADNGLSTFYQIGGTVTIDNLRTTYHPEGDEVKAYQYVVDLIKLYTTIYNLQLILNRKEWQGAPLIPDNQVTANPLAIKPATVLSFLRAAINSLGEQAILSDPETAANNMTAAIDEVDPKKLNVAIVVQLSGNYNTVDVDLAFGFKFGGTTNG